MKLHNAITYAALTAICLMLVIPIIVYTFPIIAGADSSYTVMSGSMSPALRPGDLVIVKEEDPAAVEVGDILTVRSGDYVFTHRVVEKLEGDRFRLKGDANEEPDQGLIEASQIIGKVVLIFPFSHLYTPYGFALALLAPAALIIGKQMHTIHQSTKRRNRRETMRWRRKSHSALGTGTVLLALILMVSTTRIIAPRFIGGSSSYFSDVEWGTGFFSAGIWEIGATVDIDPNTLNLKSDGEWITAYIQTEYDEKDIVLNSVTLDGSIPAVTDPKYDFVTNPDEYLVDLDKDGKYDARMVKFGWALVITHLGGYEDGAQVKLTVSGEFTYGVVFSGFDTITVKHGVLK